ncbi:MAG: SLC5 family protein [Thermoguttaceae bacterium]|jgi:SSS family solute:Na+ symporter
MQSLTRLDLVVFAIYVVAVIILGLIASLRKNTSKRDYFLAGDQMPWWMIGGSIVASNISSHHIVGALGMAYTLGFVTVCNEWGAVLIGLAALLWIFLPFYLRNGFYTMPEFLQRRFGTGPRVVFGLLILLTYLFAEISGVLVLGGLVFYNLFDIPLRWCVIILAVATAVYTIAGGLRAVIWTEMLQLSVLLLGAGALALATFNKAGGVEAFWETRGDWHLILPASDPNFPWTMYLGGLLCISIFYFAANQFIVQRVLSAKNEWHARMGVVFTCYLKFLLPLVIVVPGIMAGVMIKNGSISPVEKPDEIFPQLVKELLPQGLVGLVLAGLVAAIMGHVSGALNSCSTIATIDFYLPFVQWRKARKFAKSRESPPVKKEVSHPGEISDEDRRAICFGRCFGVVCIIVGIIWAELLAKDMEKPIFLYLLNAYGYFTPGIATMFLMGIFWKRTTYAGAVFAGLVTIPLSLLLEWLPKVAIKFPEIPFIHFRWYDQLVALPEWHFPQLSFMNRTGIVFWVCMVGCFLISLVTKPRPESEIGYLIWNKESLKLPEDQRVRGLARPGFWYIVIALVILSFYVMFP